MSGLEGPLGAGDNELAEHLEYPELLTAWAQVQSTGVSDFTGSFPWAGQAQWEDERTRVWLAQGSEEEAPQQGFLAGSTTGAERDRRGFWERLTDRYNTGGQQSGCPRTCDSRWVAGSQLQQQ